MNIQRLSDSEFKTLSRFIEDSVGIRMPDNKRIMLEGRLNKRLRTLKISTFDEYINFAFSPEQRNGELVHMIDVVTTNKTDFFRESDHFDFLTEKLLPSRYRDSGWGARTPLRVWSTASSTGEEPYTLAMVLEEFSSTVSPFSYSLLATDISTHVLEKARAAVYTETRLEPVPQALKKKYFLKSRDREKGLVRVKPALRKKVVFSRLNLMQERYPLRQPFEIVFCRNVIIYFDRDRQLALLKRLYDQLVPGGYLFVGHSETLTGTSIPFQTVAPTVYRKPGGANG